MILITPSWVLYLQLLLLHLVEEQEKTSRIQAVRMKLTRSNVLSVMLAHQQEWYVNTNKMGTLFLISTIVISVVNKEPVGCAVTVKECFALMSITLKSSGTSFDLTKVIIFVAWFLHLLPSQEVTRQHIIEKLEN